MTRQQESDIIARVVAGENDAFEELVVENQKKVYNIAQRMTNNPEDAYDLSQEAFLRAFRSLPLFRGESSFSSWMYRLTANVCIDHIRKKKKEKIISLNYIDREGGEAETELADLSNLPETELERAEMRRELENAITLLTSEHKKAIILRDVTGLSYAEIAEITETEIGTVKSRIFRARLQLKRILESGGNFFSDVTSNKSRGGDARE